MGKKKEKKRERKGKESKWEIKMEYLIWIIGAGALIFWYYLFIMFFVVCVAEYCNCELF